MIGKEGTPVDGKDKDFLGLEELNTTGGELMIGKEGTPLDGKDNNFLVWMNRTLLAG